jgi:hypothetical protein
MPILILLKQFVSFVYKDERVNDWHTALRTVAKIISAVSCILYQVRYPDVFRALVPTPLTVLTQQAALLA